MLGLSCQQLSKADVEVVGGKIQASVLPNIAFIFVDTQNILHIERLDLVNVLEPIVDGPRPDYSIIGLDILQRFDKLIFGLPGNEIALER